MKKIGIMLSIFIFLLVIVACKPEETVVVDQDPVISGAVDRTINRGDQFIPLQGITANDEEDGDLTNQVTYSGNVNPNVAGTYQATYTVVDSAGNIDTVSVVITVIIVDEEEPLISGAGDVTIMIGDPAFTILSGVTANDTIDGDLTADIVTEGVVNVWVPDDYSITYTVEDEAGNEASRTRTVTVSLGYFAFGDTSALTNGEFADNADGWNVVGATPTVASGTLSLAITAAATITQNDISGGVMNTSVADFTLAKLVITAKADAATTIQPILGGTTGSTSGIALTTEFAEYVFYFRMNAALVDEDLEFDLGSTGTIEIQSMALYFGVPSDDEDPVINAPTTEVVAPVDNLAALTSLILRGVTAVDNIDGNITSRIVVDTTGIDLAVPGTVTIPLKVSDNAGNETIVNRTVHLNLAFDASVIDDPTFDNALDEAQWGLSGGGGEVTLYNQDGAMVLDVVSTGGWDSAQSPFLKGVTTNDLLAENWYMFKFDVKADKARQMRIRAGLELWADPWIEDFLGGAVKNLQYQVTTEWQTIYYVFYVDAAQSSAGSNGIKFEIKLGTITWGGEEANNKISIDNAQFFLLTMQDDEPVVSNVANKQTTFGPDATAPDWKTYISVNDTEDGVIAVTDAMVNASAVNFAVPGNYDIVYTVEDNGGNSVTHTITIKVLAAADTTLPVLTVDTTLPTAFDQADTGTVDLKAYVTANDDVDGVIVITEAMIDDDGFSLQVAGTYDVVFTVLDSSLNSATVTVTLTVGDTQGPVISGAEDITITVGDTFNPLDGVTAVDNIDGAIVIALEDVTGLDAFLNVSGEAIVAGEFDVTYTVEDALGNVGTLTIKVTVIQVEFDDTLATDLLALAIPIQNDGGNVESVGVYNGDGSLTVTYNGVKGWYGSYSKITYASVNLLEGRMYKLVVEAKADTARDILVRFVGADGTTALAAFAGRKVVSIGAEYAVFEYIFSLDQTGPYNVQLQFGWESNLTNASDANVMYFKQFKLVPEMVIEYDVDNAVDFLALETAVGNDGGDVEASSVYNVDGSLTVTYNGVKGWYGSYSKITYYQSLVEGMHYKLVIEGKAQSARDILIRFVDGSNVAVPGFENRKVIALGTDYAVIEIEFVAPATGDFNLQLQFGWESNLTNASNANVIDINQFKLIPEMGEVVIEPLVFVLEDFNDYVDQTAFDAVYTHRVPNAGANHNDAHLALVNDGMSASQGVKFMIGEHAVTGWDLLRTQANFDNTGLTNEYGYFAFWFKGDGVITNIYVWLYWSGSQNSQMIDVSSVPAEGGWVYVPVSAYGKTATEITQFAVGYNHTNTTFKATVYLDHFMFVNDPSALPVIETPAVTFGLENFNDYVDQAAFDLVYAHRISGANHSDAHVTLDATAGVDGSKAIKFMLGEHAITGWDLVRTKANFDNTGLTDDLGYFAFWYKGDASVTTISLWLYWSGGQDSKPIDVSAVPATGGYVYLPVSLWSKTATQIIQFAVGYNHTSTTFKATIYLDNFMFIDDITNINS